MILFTLVVGFGVVVDETFTFSIGTTVDDRVVIGVGWNILNQMINLM